MSTKIITIRKEMAGNYIPTPLSSSDKTLKYLKNLLWFLAAVTLLSRTRGLFTSQKLWNEENLKDIYLHLIMSK